MKLDNEVSDLQIYKNFWSQEVLDILQKRITDWKKNKAPVNIQYNQWNHNVILDSNVILIYNLSRKKEIIKTLKKELDAICNTSTFNYFECGLHFLLRGSYVPWHNDGRCSFSCTTYMNKEDWNWNWGGAMIYEKQEDELYAEFPEYNKMIAGYNGLRHSTSILSPSSIPRISLQIFASPEEKYPY